MIVVEIQLKERLCYNSMSGPGTVYTDKVKEWLVKEMASKISEVLNISEWRVITHEKCVPQQGSNPNECGLFTVMCADFLSDYLRMSYSLKDMDFFRRKSQQLLGHVNFDGQNHRFIKKGNKNGFISGFGHYFPYFGYLLRYPNTIDTAVD